MLHYSQDLCASCSVFQPVKKGLKNDLTLRRNFYRCNVLKQTLDFMTLAGIDPRTYTVLSCRAKSCGCES